MYLHLLPLLHLGFKEYCISFYVCSYSQSSMRGQYYFFQHFPLVKGGTGGLEMDLGSGSSMTLIGVISIDNLGFIFSFHSGNI